MMNSSSNQNPSSPSRSQRMIKLSICNSVLTVQTEGDCDNTQAAEESSSSLLTCTERISDDNEQPKAPSVAAAMEKSGTHCIQPAENAVTSVTESNTEDVHYDPSEFLQVDDSTARQLLAHLLTAAEEDEAPDSDLEIGDSMQAKSSYQLFDFDAGDLQGESSKEDEDNSDESYKPEGDTGNETDYDSVVDDISPSPASSSEEESSLNTEESVLQTEARQTEEAPRKRAKKGAAVRSTWKSEKNKQLRMEGKAYVGSKKDPSTGKFTSEVKDSRTQGPACKSDFCIKSSHRHCNEILQEDRDTLFREFWIKMDWSQRKTYVSSLVKYLPTASPKEATSRRGGTFQYHLGIQGSRLQVCKSMFLNTLGLGEWSVRHWVMGGQQSHGIHKSASKIRRHQHSGSVKEQKASICKNFLADLPKLPSHYCRKRSEKMYLETCFRSKTQLYKAFQKYCEDHGSPQRVSSQLLFKEMRVQNIAIYKPKKDECNVCLAYKYGNVEFKVFQEHQQRKEESRQEKGKDKLEAEKRNGVVVLTMDLQVVLMAPLLFANATYYKTKLCCHNFTMYDLATRDVTCYFWHEGEGEVKANNFATCILDHLERVVDDSVHTVILYSDGCGYQNRNVVLSNALVHFAITHGITIMQKILEKGHTQMEVDSVHAAIENKLRGRQIFWPPEYVEVILSARKQHPYKVMELQHTFFKNFTGLSYYSSIRPGSTVGDPQVTDVRCLKYTPDGSVQYKLNYTEDWQPLPQRRRKNAGTVAFLYAAPLKIKDSKWQHLQELKEVLPKEYHHYYGALSHGNA